jgi:CRP-like cAMP-binding protein
MLVIGWQSLSQRKRIEIMYNTPAHHITSGAAPVTMPWQNLSGGNAHECKVRTHEALFCEGDDAEFLYEVVEGVMCNYRILMDGRRQIISFAYPGDLIGLGQTDCYRYSCEAVCSAKVRSISKGALMRDAQGQADLGHRLFEIATNELASMQEHQLLLGRKSALEKLASFLLVLARRSGDEGASFKLPMTRTDIADYLGLTIETVSRNMTKLKLSGVIDLPQTTTVRVCDMLKLEELAEGDDCTF